MADGNHGERHHTVPDRSSFSTTGIQKGKSRPRNSMRQALSLTITLNAKPYLKEIRESATMMRSAQINHAYAVSGDRLRGPRRSFFNTMDALGIAQHHDSVPGTMRFNRSVIVELPGFPYNVSVQDLPRCASDPTGSCLVLEDYKVKP